ncbi:MAG: hypothetical protein DMG94_01805, partial [Acidobacteria bacterium]
REEGVPGWKEFQASANPQLDAQGQPVLQANVSGHTVRIGMSRENAFRLSTPPELVQDMMLTRLEQELKPKSPHISKRQVESEWKLLQRALDERNAEMVRCVIPNPYANGGKRALRTVVLPMLQEGARRSPEYVRGNPVRMVRSLSRPLSACEFEMTRFSACHFRHVNRSAGFVF